MKKTIKNIIMLSLLIIISMAMFVQASQDQIFYMIETTRYLGNCSGDITAVNTPGDYLTGGAASNEANIIIVEAKLNATIDARDTDTDTTCNNAACNVSNTGTLDGYEASQLLDDTYMTEDNITGLGFYNVEANLTDLLDNNYLVNSSSATFSKVTGTSVCVGALCITNWDEVNKTFVDTDTFVTQDNITGWGFYNAEVNLTALLDDNYLVNGSSARFSLINVTGNSHLGANLYMNNPGGNEMLVFDGSMEAISWIDASSYFSVTDDLLVEGWLRSTSSVNGTSLCISGEACIDGWGDVNKTFVDTDTFVTQDNVSEWGFYNTETNLTDLLDDDYLVNDSGARLSVLNVSGDVSLAGTLYTDKANTRIGIGVESPDHALHLQSNSSTSLGFETVADSAAPAIVCKRAKGNTSDKQAGTPGIWMCSLSFQVWDGNSYGTAAQIVGRVGGGVSDGDVPGDLLLYTTPDGESTGEIRMAILDSGLIGINDTDPDVLLDVEGGVSRKAHFWGVRTSEYNTGDTNYNLLSFDTVYLNDSTFYTHDGTGNITINKAGWYDVSAKCSSDLDSGTREDSQCAVYVNGVLKHNCGMYSREVGVLGTSCSVPSMLNLSVNDVVGVHFRGGATGVDCGDGTNECMTFKMEYVRDAE